MRTLCRFVAALGIAALLAATARADDTRPPVISDVKAAAKGSNFTVEAKITDETGVLSATCFHRKGGSGKFEESSMVKNEYDDGFKASFPGSADTEYFIQATDLLGNGPSSFGAASKPMALAGAKPRQEKAEPAPRQPQESEVAKEQPHRREHHHHGARAPAEAKPTIQHNAPKAALADGQDAILRLRIASNPAVINAGAFARTAGTKDKPTEFPMKNISGDNWEFTIPAAMAHGSLEYILLAKNDVGQTTQGDGDDSTWFRIAFKAPQAAQQPLLISHNAPVRAAPGKPVALRAQVSPPDIATVTEDRANAVNAQMFGTSAKILFRGQDGVDQVIDMGADPSGGLGGYKSEIPAQPDGSVVYYQIVACDNSGEKCAIDTGSKRKWHAVRISSTPGAPPQPISAVSTKAPASLPE